MAAAHLGAQHFEILISRTNADMIWLRLNAAQDRLDTQFRTSAQRDVAAAAAMSRFRAANPGIGQSRWTVAASSGLIPQARRVKNGPHHPVFNIDFARVAVRFLMR